MKKLNIIWSHPRTDSLTGDVVKRITSMAEASGYEVNILDLYRSGFSPVLNTEDEPDWQDQSKDYSAEVSRLSSELSPEHPLIFVFPVWWYSLPAMLKGYIDRVWNNGVFYGEGSQRPASRILWIGLVGQSEPAFMKRGFDFTLRQTLNNGIASFCGVNNSSVKFLFDTIGDDVEEKNKHYEALVSNAEKTASAFLMQ
ncbi:NAD(P)H oxidoreductase [Klebsiella pneumoniae]|uniref:NAD(P)H oxidoreductase n=1 Tax=Klebsiella pneumoniae TaxID=573 RepID=UPI003F5584FE